MCSEVLRALEDGVAEHAFSQVKRADAIRSFIMLKYGGLYLDLDNECYRPAEESFQDFDVVLQGTGFEGVNNGMMASVAGHPIWKR